MFFDGNLNVLPHYCYQLKKKTVLILIEHRLPFLKSYQNSNLSRKRNVLHIHDINKDEKTDEIAYLEYLYDFSIVSVFVSVQKLVSIHII